MNVDVHRRKICYAIRWCDEVHVCILWSDWCIDWVQFSVLLPFHDNEILNKFLISSFCLCGFSISDNPNYLFILLPACFVVASLLACCYFRKQITCKSASPKQVVYTVPGNANQPSPMGGATAVNMDGPQYNLSVDIPPQHGTVGPSVGTVHPGPGRVFEMQPPPSYNDVVTTGVRGTHVRFNFEVLVIQEGRW